MIFSGNILTAVSFGWACPFCRADWVQFLRRVEERHLWTTSNSPLAPSVTEPELENGIATAHR